MTKLASNPPTALDTQPGLAAAESDSTTMLGFWVYLMTDCILFGSLFATYAVLHNSTFGGPGASQLFSLPFVLGETLILLTSSFTVGLAILAVQRQAKNQALIWLAATLLLGGVFLTMELTEFSHLIADGNSWQRSGFLSAYFTLVGTHGLHIATGLLWGAVIASQILRRGLVRSTARRLLLFSLFWHFLDVIWIMIFSVVYMMGAL